MRPSTGLEPGTGADAAAVAEVIGGLVEAWNRGDAEAYGARYRPDGTFTNINGDFFAGREQFNRRHAEIFRGVFRGTTLDAETRSLRFVRPDVAVADVALRVSGLRERPPGIGPGADGMLRTCLLLVLVREDAGWQISAYHNVARPAAN